MKSTRYSRFCTNIFRHFFSRHNKDELVEKNIVLAQADIPRDYVTYSSVALMNTIIGFIVTFTFALLFYTFNPSFFTLLLLVIGPIAITLSLGLMYWYLPIYCIKKRGKNIDLFLPYAINFISSMAIAGVSPAEIFQSLSTVNVYGEIQ